MQNFKYYISAFIAFMLWGFFSLALKPISYVPSFDILFYRISFSAIIIICFTLFFRRKIFLKDIDTFKNLPQKEKRKGLYLTLTGGILLGINWFLFIYVVNQINVQSASFAYLVCPIITTFLANIILKEKLQKVQWIAILISFIGCLICFISNSNNLFFALVVAFTYAFYLISQRSNIYFDKLNILTVQIILIFILSLPYYFVNGFSIPENPSFYIYIFAIATLFTLVPLYMNLYALKGAPASNVGVMLYINPLIAFMLAIFYYKEDINTLQFVSYFLILLSVFIFNYRILTNLTKKIIK
ncbi:chloramphenicol-sensitive protein RarD [Paenimyroides ummariense]|uniref:Chloramphenicol-sensitive protein RarD n=1 Tax=Paenimyroides ummariense TaxID=913024 RepID=A0A1I4YE04_9FLAO|nr:EamA family transporter [Paenimyroides ummariense]SFN35830.1 chloramphenicol-sensitive protein RarD [Paenimyroides ummariense]